MSNVDVRKEGYLRRLKTQKKRYFVLRTISLSGRPRLEYYENEKKFRNGGVAKRSIQLASCLNIAKKDDAKHSHVFALYTREDVFGLVAEDEEELLSWLEAIQDEQSKSEQLPNNVSEWFVCVKPRGLGTSKKLAGHYTLRLTSQSLMLLRKDANDVTLELELMSIRRCGHTDCFFFMEVGRSASTGAGELWIQVEDQIIAQSMHDAIMRGMQRFESQVSATICPTRSRVSSNDKSRASRNRPVSVSSSTENRDRCDSLPVDPTTPIAYSDSGKSDKSSPISKKRHKSFPRFLGTRKSRPARSRSPGVGRVRPKTSHAISLASYFGGTLGRAHSSIDFRRDLQANNISDGLVPESPNESEDAFLHFNPLDSIRRMSESSGSSHDHTKDADTSMKSLDVVITPAAEDNNLPSYMNMAPSSESEGSSTVLEDYIAMDNKKTLNVPEPYETMTVTSELRKELDSKDGYINMAALNLKEKADDKRLKPDTGTATPEGYITMVTTESEENDEEILTRNKKSRRRSTNPKQLSADVRSDFLQQMKTSNRQNAAPETLLPSQQDIKEHVTIKSSLTSTLKAKLKSVKSGSWGNEQRSSELNGTETASHGLESATQSSHSYMNFTPGQFDTEASSGRQTHAEYMNIGFEKRHSNLEKLTGSQHDYVNVDLRRRKSTPEVREYMNFTPGQMFCGTQKEQEPSDEIAESERDTLSASAEASKLSDWLEFDFGELQRTPKRNLNYATLDLKKRDTSESIPQSRIQMTDSKLLGKTSGKSSYVEIDFTKSQGLKQVLQQKQERMESAVET